jgi:hypothetical protein
MDAFAMLITGLDKFLTWAVLLKANPYTPKPFDFQPMLRVIKWLQTEPSPHLPFAVNAERIIVLLVEDEAKKGYVIPPPLRMKMDGVTKTSNKGTLLTEKAVAVAALTCSPDMDMQASFTRVMAVILEQNATGPDGSANAAAAALGYAIVECSKKKATYVCVCGKTATSVCAKCHLVTYCGEECQRQDWREHKKVCRKCPCSS